MPHGAGGLVALLLISFSAAGGATPAAQAVMSAPQVSDPQSATGGLDFHREDLDGQVRDLAIKETPTEIRIELAADVLFAFDRATLLPKARVALQQAAAVIRDKAKGTVRIVGYTDSKGSAAYNQTLSERRANAVRDWFVRREGLKSEQFVTQGFGAGNPVAPNTRPDGSDDPEGRQKNRRVEITLRK